CDSIGTLMDEPNGDRSCVPTYLLSEFTRKHVTVAISGDGGDELFGGYSRYPGFAAAYDQTPGAHPVAMVQAYIERGLPVYPAAAVEKAFPAGRSEEHTSELQSREKLVCRLQLEKK